MTDEQIDELVSNNEIDLKRVVDSVIRCSGCIGVGLITLGDNLQEYVHNHPKEVDKLLPTNFLSFYSHLKRNA